MSAPMPSWAEHRRAKVVAAGLGGVLAFVLLAEPFGFQREPLKQTTPAYTPLAAAPVPTAPLSCTPRSSLSVATGDDISAGSFRRDVLERWNATTGSPKASLLEISGSTDEQRAQMAAVAQAGSCAYDVLILDVAWVAEFARNGYIKEIEPEDPELFLTKPLEAGNVDGRQYGVPFAANAPLEFRRTDVTGHGYALQLGDSEAGTVNLLELIGRAGGKVVEGTGVVLTEERAKTWDALREWGIRKVGDQQVPVVPESIGHDEDDSLAAFRDGRTAAGNPVSHMRNWPVAFHQLAADPDLRGPSGALVFDVSAPAPGGVLGGSVLAISQHTGREAEAKDLIKWLTGETVQAQLFACGGYAPVLHSVYDGYAEGRGRDCPTLLGSPPAATGGESVEIGTAELTGLAAATRTAVESARARPPSAYYSQFSQAFRRCARGVLNHQVDEEEFFASAEMLQAALNGRIVAQAPC